MKTKEKRGITLVALVVTIVVLLILAGISISALTNTGIFEKAKEAKQKTDESQIMEWLSLKLIEAQGSQYQGTKKEILEETKKYIEQDKSDLERLGKVNNIGDIEGGDNSCYMCVVVDNNAYKIEDKGISFVGNIENDTTEPNIEVSQVDTTTKEYEKKIKVNAYDNESGIKVKKYAIGSRNLEYFKTNGTVFTGDTVIAKTSDFEHGSQDFSNIIFSVYTQNNAGLEKINTIKLENLLVDYTLKFGKGLGADKKAIGNIQTGQIVFPANSDEAIQFGPYAILPEGTYSVTVKGKNLGQYENGSFWYNVTTNSAANWIVTNTEVKELTNEFNYKFKLNEKRDAVEMRIVSRNNAIECIVDSVTIKSVLEDTE